MGESAVSVERGQREVVSIQYTHTLIQYNALIIQPPFKYSVHKL